MIARVSSAAAESLAASFHCGTLYQGEHFWPITNSIQQSVLGRTSAGSATEIRQFCSLTYDVTFPMFAKISVAGADVHPLYQALIAAQPAASGEGPMREKLVGFNIEPNPQPGVLWNFEKFLIGRDGQVIGRFAPDISADDAGLRAAIDAALAA